MINYSAQQAANLLAFFTDEELAEKRRVLLRLKEELDLCHINWALSCSGALFFGGLIDDFHDYDIVIEDDERAIDKFLQIFEKQGGTWENEDNGKGSYFDSTFFKSGRIGSVEVEVIAGFTVTTYNTRYYYDFRKDDRVIIKGIPVCPVEASMILYGMMIGWQAKRHYKYEIAKAYLKKCGVNYPHILTQNAEILPKFIRSDINLLMR